MLGIFSFQNEFVPGLACILLLYLMKNFIKKTQVHDLLKLYNEVNVPPERLLFKIPSTWQVSFQERMLLFLGTFLDGIHT